MRTEYKSLKEAIESAEAAKHCITQNRGYDKELARDGFDSVVSEDLIPAMITTLEVLTEDLGSSDVLRLAKRLFKIIETKEY